MIKKTPLDICFQSLQTFQNICCLAILNQDVDPPALRDILNKKSKEYPKLEYALGSVESKNFSATNASTHQYCQPLKEATFKYFLAELSEEFDTNLPSWKMVYSSNSKDRNFLSLIINHALGDGISGLHFFHSLSSENSSKTSKAQKPLKKPGYLGAIKSLLKEALGKPNIYTINGTNSDNRELLLLNLPYKSLQKLKKEHSTTAYAVLLALVSYFVSEYCQVNTKGSYVKPLLPVSIRGKNKPTDLSNQIGGATITLPLGEDSPDELIKKISSGLKENLTEDAYYGYYLWAYILSKLPIFIRKKLLILSAKKTSFICTNLIGPNEPISIAGAQIEEQYVIPALMPGHGLGFGFMKSNNQMQVAVIYDPEIILDRGRLRESLVRALAKMGIMGGYGIRES